MQTNIIDDDIHSIDDSWIDEQQRLLSVDQNYVREPLEYIMFYFCFINNEHMIDKIHTEKYIFPDNTSTILKSEFNSIIQAKTNENYEFSEYVLYVVDLEPEHIQSYAKSESQIQFMHPASTIIQDVICPKSIFVFQSINCIIVILKHKLPNTSIITTKSILKTSKNITKKHVKFEKNKTRHRK